MGQRLWCDHLRHSFWKLIYPKLSQTRCEACTQTGTSWKLGSLAPSGAVAHVKDACLFKKPDAVLTIWPPSHLLFNSQEKKEKKRDETKTRDKRTQQSVWTTASWTFDWKHTDYCDHFHRYHILFFGIVQKKKKKTNKAKELFQLKTWNWQRYK